MSRSVTASRRSAPRTVRARRAAARANLIASGVAPAPLLPTYDMNFGSPAGRYFTEQALASGFSHYDSDVWPCELDRLQGEDTIVFQDGSSAVHRFPDGTLALARLRGGWMNVEVATPDLESLPVVFSAFRTRYPASFLVQQDDGTVQIPVTFWVNSPYGPQPRLRRIEGATWEGIEGNYTAPVRAELDRLAGWSNGPDTDGQLLLWQGPPGTGKSWALRALVAEWQSWAEFYYITDPDSFFVKDPSYMISVLLADSYSVIEQDTGDVYQEADPEGKWRVLILEDTGELLAADAKAEYGQGLSRLLNVVDGMIGQGLRILAIVTTNDELGDLHPATTRPGRCASQIEFGPLTDEEAQAWTGDAGATAGTLAELYSRARVEEALEAIPERDESFTPEPEDARDLMASGASTASQVAAVAADHQPEDPGYGQCAYDADTGTVYWIAWDGTSREEHDAAVAAFSAVSGVEEVVAEAECIPGDGWWAAEVVYPDDPPRWVTEHPDDAAELADIVALARSPLPPLEPEAQADAVMDAVRETVALTAEEDEILTEGMRVLLAAHKATVEGVAALTASAAKERGATRGDEIALAAISAMERFALKPEAAPAQPSPIHVHVPPQDVSVQVDGATFSPQIDVHVPEQPAPAPAHVEVHVPAPHVEVTVPEQPAPQVHVAAAAAPDVHVHVPPPEPRGRQTVRVGVDTETGEKIYTSEEETEPDD